MKKIGSQVSGNFEGRRKTKKQILISAVLIFFILVQTRPAQPAELSATIQPQLPKPIRSLEQITLTDEDLNNLKVRYLDSIPLPEWARPFNEGWFNRAITKILALQPIGGNEPIFYGLALYPDTISAEEALDDYIGMCSIWLPISAWPKTGDRCWGSIVVKENVIIYGGRSGEKFNKEILPILIKRIDLVLGTSEAALASRCADAEKCLKIIGNRGHLSSREEEKQALKEFLDSKPTLPWRYETFERLYKGKDRFAPRGIKLSVDNAGIGIIAKKTVFYKNEVVFFDIKVCNWGSKELIITEGEYGFRLIVDEEEYLWNPKSKEVRPTYTRLGKGEEHNVLVTIDKDEWRSIKNGRQFLEVKPGWHAIQAAAEPHPSSEIKQLIYSNIVTIRIRDEAKTDVQVEVEKR